MSTKTGTATSFEDWATQLYNFLTVQGHAFGKKLVGTGNGDLINYAGKTATVAQTITATATSSTSFTVVGSVSGALGTATVGTPFSSAQIDFTITAGGTAYVAGDVWTINTSPKYPVNRSFNGTWVANKSNTGAVNVTHGGAAQVVQIKMVAAAQILEVGIKPTSTTAAPSAFTIDWSNDGSAWTTASTYSGITTGWVSNIERRFAVAAGGTHLWWRIRMTAFVGSTLQLDQTRFFAVANDQIDLADFPMFSVQTPGNDGVLAAVHHIYRFVDTPGADTYNVSIYPHTAWSSALVVDGQAGYTGGQLVHVALADLAMPYWFVANGRRVQTTTKVSTVYSSSYAGLLLPYTRTSAYPVPWFIGGSASSATTRWSATGEQMTNFFRPCSATPCRTKNQNGIWVAGLSWGSSMDPSSTTQARLYPHDVSAGGSPAVNTDGTSTACGDIRDNIDGTYPMLPLAPGQPAFGTWGELDGFYWTTGFNNAAENVIRAGGFDHLVVSNVFRTNPSDYAAMRLD